MKRVTSRTVLTLAMLLISGVLTQGIGYDLGGGVVGGGGRLVSTTYVLDGAIGQPEAGVLRGGVYTLVGGALSGRSSSTDHVFLPLVRH
jgi:hypothetical protein